jgi:hypothetical protein
VCITFKGEILAFVSKKHGIIMKSLWNESAQNLRFRAWVKMWLRYLKGLRLLILISFSLSMKDDEEEGNSYEILDLVLLKARGIDYDEA